MSTHKINVAVIGYGNIGKNAIQAILNAPDMNLVGVVRRNAKPIDEPNIKVAERIEDLDRPLVCVLCAPSRLIPEMAAEYMQKGYYTVDSFDIHGQIPEVRDKLRHVAQRNGLSCILSAGWDPGTDSVIRALMTAMAPNGITYTNFGPGMSMGHSVAAKAISGVFDAVSMTMPQGAGIHNRVVYVQLNEGASFESVSKAIKADEYFCHDNTQVIEVPDIAEIKQEAHGVDLIRYGSSSNRSNQNIRFEMKIDNPALTAQILTGCVRAAIRQKPGCYTLIEIPPVDLLPGSRERWIKELV